MRIFLLLTFGLHALFALTLDEAIQTALKKSPLLHIQKNRALQAREEKEAKKAKTYGKVVATASYTHYNIPRTLAPIVPPISPNITTSKDITSYGAMYEVVLFNGFADVSSIKIANLEYNIATIDYGLSKAKLIFNIKSLYYKILSLQQELQSAKSYKKALERLYRDVKKEVTLGKKAKIDLLKVNSDLQSASFAIVNLQKNLEILQSQLAYTIGIDSIKNVHPAKESLHTNPIQKSFSYKKAFMESKKAQKAIQKAKSLYYPKLSLNLLYTKNFGQGSSKELWQSSLGLNWNIFDFGYKKHEVQKAKIASLIAKEKLLDTKRSLQTKVEEAKRRIEIAKAKIDTTKVQLRLLQKIKETEMIKYEKGISDMYDLLYAIAKYEGAQSALFQAMYDLDIQKAYYNYITAGER